uniref:Uncharacterized protein n=1 Tax=Plectus sambesii TaxID=2011161 RepID=A0A914V6R8_9BILA
MTVIGVAGVTCGGKTTLSERLVHLIKAELKSAVVVNQDDFFLPKMDVARIWKQGDPSVLFYDYDSPKSVDAVRFADAVDRALLDNDIVVVDGNMLTEFPCIYEKLAKVLFITLDKETCRKRRVVRTDYDPADVPGYFDQIVWPAYQQHVEHAKERADVKCIFLDGSKHPDDALLQQILRELDRDLIRIQTDTISVQEATQFVTAPTNGAISLFIGTTRDNFRGKKVMQLEYEAYEEMAAKELHRLCHRIRAKHPSIDRIAIMHRLGVVPVTYASVVIATSSPHRQDAMAATQFAIDELKRTVPIFKK